MNSMGVKIHSIESPCTYIHFLLEDSTFDGKVDVEVSVGDEVIDTLSCRCQP